MLVHPVWVDGRGRQTHQIDDVDEAQFQLRDPLAQQGRRGQRLERRHVPDRGQDDVGLARLGAGPVPDRGTGGGVLARRIEVEVLQMPLLVGDDQVDVVAAREAVLGDGEQGVGVGG